MLTNTVTAPLSLCRDDEALSPQSQLVLPKDSKAAAPGLCGGAFPCSGRCSERLSRASSWGRSETLFPSAGAPALSPFGDSALMQNNQRLAMLGLLCQKPAVAVGVTGGRDRGVTPWCGGNSEAVSLLTASGAHLT